MTKLDRERLVHVPGSKSISNRALICAALANSQSVITNLAPGDDTQAMFDSLQTLGVAISRAQDGVTINGGLDLESTTVVELRTRLAGTTSRFLTAVASLRNGATTVDGDESLRTRPMSGLHDALRALGASVVCSGVDGHLPVTVKRGGSWQNQIAIDSTTSSQFTSALMMIAPYFSKGLEIELRGQSRVARILGHDCRSDARIWSANRDFWQHYLGRARCVSGCEFFGRTRCFIGVVPQCCCCNCWDPQ